MCECVPVYIREGTWLAGRNAEPVALISEWSQSIGDFSLGLENSPKAFEHISQSIIMLKRR